NESRLEGGQAPDQASSGRQTGAAARTRTVHSQGTHTAASHPTSHTRHGDNQAGNCPRQTNSASLTVPRRGQAKLYVQAARICTWPKERSKSVLRATKTGFRWQTCSPRSLRSVTG